MRRRIIPDEVARARAFLVATAKHRCHICADGTADCSVTADRETAKAIEAEYLSERGSRMTEEMFREGF